VLHPQGLMEHAMATKRSDSFEEFQRKQRDKRAALPPSDHNIPGLPSLSHEEITYVEAARAALVTIKRTFEFWIVIARGLKTLKDKAERIGGRFTFDRLREREGLGGRDKHGKEILNKTRVSRLLAILEHVAEVEKWRADLTDKQRFDWASPEAVWRHCPVFAQPKNVGEERALSPYERLKEANIKLQEEIVALKKSKDDERWTPTEKAEDVATTIIGMFSLSKAKDIAERILSKLKEHKARPGKSTHESRRGVDR
jgi:hypothetical protein